MTMELMANAGGGDDLMISGKWLIALAVAVIPALGAVWIKAKALGQKEAQEASVTVKKPVPTVTIREEAQWATRPELEDHIERSDKQFCEIWQAIQAERGIARTALSRIHERLDNQTTATATLQGTVDEVKGTVAKLLDLALGKKPQTGR
jgi:hypothetical protein